ncbi:Hsp70 family protein [uncultured Treponema sp.]|uniref:Hsp70 family protein n=1 Tax=uncultured Treponema sp. TaxID=162155 RepID=UPI0025D21AF8|nr:Hsp70 family protein [uncultured Treponema sp.]
MKTIGIKLADGTFYPVLEEGEAKKRMLDLTTAKDNQTKVQIDLYRSENGTMDDAEYVDTLEVTKLNPHPNGEPELHLSVGLDEENHLTAEVVDPETGKKSETEVTLVSRTAEERAEPADFALSSSSESSSEETVEEPAPEAEESAVTETAEITEENLAKDASESTFPPQELPELNSSVLEDMPFHFDHSEPPKTNIDLNDGFEGAKPDFSALDNDVPVEDKTLESVDFSAKHSDETNDLTENNDLTETPDFDAGSEIQTDTTTIEDDTTIADDSVSVADDFSTEDFSLPDIEDNSSFDSFDSTSSSQTEDSTLPDFDDDFTATTKSDSDFDSSSEPEGFDLPDFDSDFSDTKTSGTATGLNFDDFNDLDKPATDDSSSISDDDLFGTSSATTMSGSAMDFSDLYDKETLAGEHASLYDEEEETKKTRTPVIICIICAIICVIATILVLFIVPSKYNLIASRNTNGVSILDKFFSKEKTVVEKPVEEAEEGTKFIDVEVEEEPAPEAVEDKIIIAPEPEKVVPVPPPSPVEQKKPEVKKTSDVKYHIRWGDTLWDISESYYKTPWKYPKIATYNKIKNPDLIISGTDILIPAE